MIIHKPEITENQESLVLSARVEIESKKNYPDYLWYKIPKKFQYYITNSSNPFAASLSLLSSRLHENLTIQGTLSPRLAWGMQDYIQTFRYWYPGLFSEIEIKSEIQIESNCFMNEQVAASFSGGVDSFYTLLRHQPQTTNILPISYAFFIHGFDIPLNELENYKSIKNSYEKHLLKLGIELIPISTNVRDFLPSMKWEEIFGGPLSGAIFCFKNLFHYYLIPSAFDNHLLMKQGTDPRLVPLLATEFTSIQLDAGNISRAEKTAFIANNPMTYSNLRVCWEKIDGLNNCGRCEKCVRTMTELELTEKLHYYKNFNDSWNLGKIRQLHLDSSFKIASWDQIKFRAKEIHRNDIIRAINIAIFFSKFYNGQKYISRLSCLMKQTLRKLINYIRYA